MHMEGQQIQESGRIGPHGLSTEKQGIGRSARVGDKCEIAATSEHVGRYEVNRRQLMTRWIPNRDAPPRLRIEPVYKTIGMEVEERGIGERGSSFHNVCLTLFKLPNFLKRVLQIDPYTGQESQGLTSSKGKQHAFGFRRPVIKYGLLVFFSFPRYNRFAYEEQVKTVCDQATWLRRNEFPKGHFVTSGRSSRVTPATQHLDEEIIVYRAHGVHRTTEAKESMTDTRSARGGESGTKTVRGDAARVGNDIAATETILQAAEFGGKGGIEERAGWGGGIRTGISILKSSGGRSANGGLQIPPESRGSPREAAHRGGEGLRQTRREANTCTGEDSSRCHGYEIWHWRAAITHRKRGRAEGADHKNGAQKRCATRANCGSWAGKDAKGLLPGVHMLRYIVSSGEGRREAAGAGGGKCSAKQAVAKGKNKQNGGAPYRKFIMPLERAES
ncbi:hypothetical protein B0H19DRAFT_1084552 [Mycena capillaripes]|nr:hypothetical protein B0H19DRAFT_1084552 [Mycena capillaripes]